MYITTTNTTQHTTARYYRDENCGELGSFLGIPPGSCQQDNAKFTCSGGAYSALLILCVIDFAVSVASSSFTVLGRGCFKAICCAQLKPSAHLIYCTNIKAKAQMELYSRSSCGGIKLGTTTIPSLCTPYKDVGSDDLIDDAFYAPGKAAESVTVSCMEAHVENSDPGNNGSSGGGAASFLRQLDARAVAGVVAGSILALLAL